ncbi:MAG TPA: hypothetical protein VE994_15355 [Terriglobales bacterium]|nr:hypothetical protein [Terriglobales bacterium]
MGSQIEVQPTNGLIRHARKARPHSDDQAAQIAEFGFTTPILIGGDDVIIARQGQPCKARAAEHVRANNLSAGNQKRRGARCALAAGADCASQPPRQRSIRRQGGGPQHEDVGVPYLARHPRRRLFRFHAGGALRDMLKTAMANAGLSFPRRQGGFHIFCHSYGTLMKRYGNLDTYGLVRTDRWRYPRSADRYNHTAPSEEARRADLLPMPPLSRPRRRKLARSHASGANIFG